MYSHLLKKSIWIKFFHCIFHFDRFMVHLKQKVWPTIMCSFHNLFLNECVYHTFMFRTDLIWLVYSFKKWKERKTKERKKKVPWGRLVLCLRTIEYIKYRISGYEVGGRFKDSQGLLCSKIFTPFPFGGCPITSQPKKRKNVQMHNHFTAQKERKHFPAPKFESWTFVF